MVHVQLRKNLVDFKFHQFHFDIVVQVHLQHYMPWRFSTTVVITIATRQLLVCLLCDSWLAVLFDSWLAVKTYWASPTEVCIHTTSMHSGCSVNSASTMMTRCWHRQELLKCWLFSRFAATSTDLCADVLLICTLSPVDEQFTPADITVRCDGENYAEVMFITPRT